MYLQRFRLRTLPFRLSPDTAFLYPSTSHAHALDTLRRMPCGAGGVTLMTGPGGVGKTTLVDRFLLDLPVSTAVARLNQGLPSTIAVLQGLLIQFGYAPYHLTRSELGSALHTFLMERERAGEQTLVVVDEAQRLDTEALLELVRAATPASPRLHLLLAGDPILNERLEQIDMAPIQAAITHRISLSPLRPDEIAHYIQHRLDTAGAEGRHLFENLAIDMLMRVTSGLPKFINKLADGAMAAAYEDGRDIVRSDDVLAASRLLGTIEHSQRRSDPPLPLQSTPVPAVPVSPPEDTRPMAAAQRKLDPEPETAPIRASHDTSAKLQSETDEKHDPVYRVHLRHAGLIIETAQLIPGEFYIGRTRENDMQIESRYISRRHCRLTLTENQITIEDLDSTNGVRMAGEPVWLQTLQSGDVVQLGRHELIIELVSPGD